MQKYEVIFMDYAKLTVNDKTAPKDLLKVFKRAGAEIAQSSVGKEKRENSTSFKPIFILFSDSQSVELRVKKTGDIYQVRLNNKVLPIKNQDDEKLAAGEIVKAVEGNSRKFQALQARKKVKFPVGLKSTFKRKEEILQERINELDKQIAEAKAILATDA